MVVVERENVLNNVKREGELFGRGKCREEHVQGNMSYTHICDAIPPSIYRDTRSFRHGRMDSVAERNATHRNSAIPPARCWNSQTCGKYNTVLLAASSYVTQWLLSPNVESKSGSSPPPLHEASSPPTSPSCHKNIYRQNADILYGPVRLSTTPTWQQVGDNLGEATVFG